MSERCVNCGALLPEGAKLCTSCGKIVTKNSRLRPEQNVVRRPTPDVTTQSRVYSHKPTPTAVMEIVDEEQDYIEHRPERPSAPAHKKKKPSSKAKTSGKKKSKTSGRVKFVIAFVVLAAAVLMLVFMLIYTLKVREVKNLAYEPQTPFKMSYSTFGEASAHFFEEDKWSYDVFSGEVTVEGVNKGTYYKYIFEDGKVTCVIVGKDVFKEELTDEKEIDILVARMFV